MFVRTKYKWKHCFVSKFLCVCAQLFLYLSFLMLVFNLFLLIIVLNFEIRVVFIFFSERTF